MDVALAIFKIGAGIGVLAAGAALVYLAWQTTPLIKESRALTADLRRLTRAADAILARVDLTDWTRGYCPVCGGEPDLAVITPAAERLLICSRCLARWRFDQIMCPFCRNEDRSRITSFTSRDGRYRLSACDVCERYLKAYDARNASRPVMPAVDSVATLPLDAAAMQRGYK